MSTRLRRRVRQDTIITNLRDSIVRGKKLPGSRLPTRLEMAARYGTTVVTVQRALDHLAADGFVRANGRSGTYVSENPPHLSHYALVFGYRPEFPDTPWVGVARAMREVAYAMQRAQSRRLSIYFYSGFEMHRTEDYDRIVEGVLNHTIAGLIFAESPHRMRNTPVLQAPGVPRVALMSDLTLSGVDAVSVDWRGFYDRALDHLHARGRRRVAILSQGQPDEFRQYVRAAVERRGMKLPPYAWIASRDSDGNWAREAAHALLHDGQRERPDALIIGEDVLVEFACAGVAASGVAVERNLDVVAHCNYPTVPAKLLPIRLLGFDIAQFLDDCIRHIDRVRRGESTPKHATMPALFEDELVTRKSEVVVEELAAPLAMVG